MSQSPSTVTESLSAAMARRVDAVCSQFDAAWQTVLEGGCRPRLEDYLGDLPASVRRSLLQELVLVDVEYRRLRGEIPEVKDYDRFPELEPSRLNQIVNATTGGPAAKPDTSHDTPAAQPAAMGQSDDGGRFQLLERVGVGAFGTVWRAQDRQLYRLVALKIPH